MAIYDRDYVFRNSHGRGGGGGMSANKALILANVAVFIGQLATRQNVGPDLLSKFGAFSTFAMIKNLEFWRVLTFQFLHANIMHILMNMIGLWVFGQFVEAYLGRARYLALYLTSGISGAAMYMLLNAAGEIAASNGAHGIPLLIYNSFTTPLVGASAGVFGVVMAAAYVAPNQQLQLIFPPVPIRVKTLAYVYLGLALLNLITGGQNQGGDAAHVGGAIAGFILIRNAHLLRDFFDVFSDSRKPKRDARKNAKASQAQSTRDAEIDRVLAKVRDKGLSSLSNREKRLLQDATEAQRKNAR